MTHTLLVYDGSFDGFLCAVFMVYEQKMNAPSIQKQQDFHQQLFATTETVITETHKAQRVWEGIRSKTSRAELRTLFRSFLSEIKGIENTLLYYIQTVLRPKHTITGIDYSHTHTLRMHQIAKMVSREKHRMEAFVRFQRTKDGIYAATITPDFNVLPLIIGHFKDRYADQKWMIYDLKRDYGIYYDLDTVSTITIPDFTQIMPSSYATQETDFQKLWSTYYQHVNISERKNKRLHMQHIPKRYWKYLTEKKIL